MRLVISEILAGGSLVSAWCCVASTDRLPVVVRFPAGPPVKPQVVTRRKATGAGQKKKNGAVLLLSPAGMALCVSVFLFLCLVFFLLWPYQDDDT